MKFKITPKLIVGVGITGLYLFSIGINFGEYLLETWWAERESKKYFILNEQYWKLIKYQDEIYKESKTRWQFVPGSFLWRLPERPELEPLEFDEPDEEQYKKPMIANGLEKISQEFNRF